MRDRARGADDAPSANERSGGRRPTSAPCLVHETILRMRLVSLGDLILDVIVGLDGPLVSGDDRAATTRVGAGGQAANVAAWAAVARRRGALRREARRRRRRRARGPRARGTRRRARRARRAGETASSSRSPRAASDRWPPTAGSATELEPDELDPAWFDCDRLHLSGYALLVEPVAARGAPTPSSSRASRRRVDLGRPLGLEPDRRAVSRAGAPLRARASCSRPSAEREAFGPLEAAWVVKRGAARR